MSSNTTQSYRSFDSHPVQEKPTVAKTALVILRNRIFAGMVIVLPILMTGYIVMSLGSWLYNKTQAWIQEDIESALKQSAWLVWATNEYVLYVVVVLISIFVIGGALYLVGLLSAAYAVKRLVAAGEVIISKIPFVSFIYNLFKQIMASVAAQSDKSAGFKKVVLIDYPRPGIKSVAFVTGETHIEEQDLHFVNLFVPTTPNPTSGFMLMLPPDQVLETNLRMEQATKFILSFGIINPANLLVRPYSSEDTRKPLPEATMQNQEGEEVPLGDEPPSGRGMVETAVAPGGQANAAAPREQPSSSHQAP